MVSYKNVLAVLFLGITLVLGAVHEAGASGGGSGTGFGLGNHEMPRNPKIIRAEIEKYQAESALHATNEAYYTEAMEKTVAATILAISIISFSHTIIGTVAAIKVGTAVAAKAVATQWAVTEVEVQAIRAFLQYQLKEP